MLYHAETTAAEQMQQSEEEGQAEMQAWMTWAQNVGPALIDFGAPLGSSTVVSADGVGTSTTTAAGYSIIEASDLDAASALMDGHPHLRIGTIQIHEVLAVPGM